MRELGLERAEGPSEPEDHAAILCEIMAVLISGEFATTVARQRHFFEEHLVPWIGRFFANLETAEHAEFYQPVGTLGRLFIGIEREAFALPL